MDTSVQGKKILVPLEIERCIRKRKKSVLGWGEEKGRLRSKNDNYLWTKFECYEVKYFEME